MVLDVEEMFGITKAGGNAKSIFESRVSSNVQRFKTK